MKRYFHSRFVLLSVFCGVGFSQFAIAQERWVDPALDQEKIAAGA